MSILNQKKKKSDSSNIKTNLEWLMKFHNGSVCQISERLNSRIERENKIILINNSLSFPYQRQKKTKKKKHSLQLRVQFYFIQKQFCKMSFSNFGLFKFLNFRHESLGNFIIVICLLKVESRGFLGLNKYM